MTWPTDMDTARMQATINQQAERIHQLKDQVTRLQRAYVTALDEIDWFTPTPDWDNVLTEHGLRLSDLDILD